jgi:hypothetical protein
MVLELQTTHREELTLVVRRQGFYLMPVQQLAGGVIDAGDGGLVAGLGLHQRQFGLSELRLRI